MLRIEQELHDDDSGETPEAVWEQLVEVFPYVGYQAPREWIMAACNVSVPNQVRAYAMRRILHYLRNPN